MSIIYKPAGKAGEYAEYAANLYSGCEHNCSYCYAPAATYKTRLQFKLASPRKDVIKKLELQLKKESYRGKEVLMSFTCDPYQQINEKYGLTRQAIEIFLDNEILPVILSKGGNRSLSDFDLLSKTNSKYGVTLTTINDSLQNEPEAAPYQERINALKKAKTKGISTWVSLEPVMNPVSALNIISTTHSFVDMFKIGKWNYDKRANLINWRDFVHKAVDLLENYGKAYAIKKDLQVYI